MKKVIWLFLMLSFVSVVQGQRTLKYTNSDADYERALQLFEREKYGAAQRAFQKVYDRISDAHSEIKMSAEYHIAMCALELFNDDAEQLFVDFIKHHPQNPKIRKARFQLGRYNYRVKSWSGTIEWMEQVDVNDLESYEVQEYHFKYGYALFKRKDIEAAKQHFFEAKDDTSSNYSEPSLFYYAHLMYEEQNYETALKHFQELQSSNDFGVIVPYYISQIYFLQKKHDALIKYAPSLIEGKNTKRSSEISRMLGDAYYEKQDFKNSAKYLLRFIESTGSSDTKAIYQLAYSYWKTEDYEKAKEYFQKSAEMDTEIGQLSLYYLGNIYLNDNDKKSARNAYRFASKLEYNNTIQEDALFNYAKLSYELDIDPYHESIIAMEKYIATYPDSKRSDEARKYLLNVYLNTQNYDRALSALEQIEDKNMDLQYAYQKISYYRGVELFNSEKIGFGNQDNSNYKAAITYFNRASKYPIDSKIAALCHYWTAEAYYRIDHFEKAIEYYKKFKSDPTASLLDEFESVDYNIGYALWGMREYGPAIRSFRGFLTSHKANDSKALDAQIRVADGFLILRINEGDLRMAVKYYKRAISLNTNQSDYCYFQLAQAYKLLNEYVLQAEALEHLIYTYPTSKYADDAKFAIGETYLHHLQKYELALKYFNDIVNNHSNNIEITQDAHNSLGFTYRSMNKHEKALESFEQSVALNPRSEIAQGAIQAHKETCVNELGDAQRHINFRENIGLPSLSLSAKDSSVFIAAKKFYLEEEYNVAIKNLEAYLNDYPKALFRTPALYFLGDAYLNQKDSTEALKKFDRVIEMPKGEFTESALYQAGRIYFVEGEFNKSIVRFKALEEITEYDSYRLNARVGLMRSYKELENHESTTEYAKKVMSDPKVENNTKYEAILYKGKAHLALFEFNRAIIEFDKIKDLKQKEMGAEASYNLAYIQYLKENFDQSTEMIYQIAKEYSGFKYWVTKSFILLSDNFVKKEDLFQAKYVLKTVVENSADELLKLEALDKISAIEKMERAQNQPEEKVDEEWKVGEATEEEKKLFDEGEEEEQLEKTPVMENDTLR